MSLPIVGISGYIAWSLGLFGMRGFARAAEQQDVNQRLAQFERNTTISTRIALV